jgi:hypothetical protein
MMKRDARTRISPATSSSAVRIVLSVFFYALAAGATARAESPERIDSLCHPWSATPCLVRVAASLRSATSGEPLRGKRLRFVAGNTTLCTSTTDMSGWATCLGVAPSGQSLEETGYRAVFDGDDRYWAESAAVRAGVRRASLSE